MSNLLKNFDLDGDCFRLNFYVNNDNEWEQNYKHVLYDEIMNVDVNDWLIDKLIAKRIS